MDDCQLKKAGFWDLLLLALGRLKRFRVQGDSMLPVLRQSDEVLMMPLVFKSGDIVIARHPLQTDLIVIKKLTLLGGGKAYLSSLNSAGSDSRLFGLIDSKNILGKAWAILPG